MRALSWEIGRDVRPHVFDRRDEPGYYESSHAEAKAAARTGEQVHATEKPICPSCQEFFSKLAQAQDRPFFVGDPDGVWVFAPDGRAVVEPHPTDYRGPVSTSSGTGEVGTAVQSATDDPLDLGPLTLVPFSRLREIALADEADEDDLLGDDSSPGTRSRR